MYLIRNASGSRGRYLTNKKNNKHLRGSAPQGSDMPVKSPGCGRGVKAHPAVAFAPCTITHMRLWVPKVPRLVFMGSPTSRCQHCGGPTRRGFPKTVPDYSCPRALSDMIIIITFTRERPEGFRHASPIPREGDCRNPAWPFDRFEPCSISPYGVVPAFKSELKRELPHRYQHCERPV
jgi:hypothetical protein